MDNTVLVIGAGLSKIFRYRESDFTSTLIQEKMAFKCQNIKIIGANADEILLGDL